MQIIQRVLVCLSIAFATQADACIYFDAKLNSKHFKETTRAALMFHDGQMANLILKTQFEGKIPRRLTWVLPLPSKPVSYKSMTWDIFPALSNAIQKDSPSIGEKGSRSLGTRGIKIHPTEVAGDFEITPIEILSENAGNELNSWLKNQQFIESPVEIQRSYLIKGAFYLAIRTSIAATKVSLKPLWIRYPATTLSFPLRFTHDYRTFDLDLFFLSSLTQTLVGPSGKDWNMTDNPNIKQSSIRRFAKENPSEIGAEPYHLQDVIYRMDDFSDQESVSKFLARRDLQLLNLKIKGVNQKKLLTKNLLSDPGLR